MTVLPVTRVITAHLLLEVNPLGAAGEEATVLEVLKHQDKIKLNLVRS